MPHLLGQVMGFQRCAIFFESDAPKAFYMVDLHEDSRNLTTVWTRKFGKVRFTRLNFGHKNASTVLQTRMSRALQPLPASSREAVKNYADDFVGGAEGEEEIFCVLRDFLTLAIVPNNISLKASKTRIGYPTATYGGYVLGSGQRSIAEKHLAPILDMLPPTSLYRRPFSPQSAWAFRPTQTLHRELRLDSQTPDPSDW